MTEPITMKVAATYTFVVDVPAMQLSPDGRPPKSLSDWDGDTRDAVDEAVEAYIHSVSNPFDGADTIEIIEHPAWEGSNDQT